MNDQDLDQRHKRTPSAVCERATLVHREYCQRLTFTRRIGVRHPPSHHHARRGVGRRGGEEGGARVARAERERVARRGGRRRGRRQVDLEGDSITSRVRGDLYILRRSSTSATLLFGSLETLRRSRP